MVVKSKIAQRMFGDTEVFVAAIRLTGMPGIYVDADYGAVEYFHLILDDHHVILADGAPTESLYVGPEALKNIGA